MVSSIVFDNTIYVLHLSYAKMCGNQFHLGPAALLIFTPLNTTSHDLMNIVIY